MSKQTSKNHQYITQKEDGPEEFKLVTRSQKVEICNLLVDIWNKPVMYQK